MNDSGHGNSKRFIYGMMVLLIGFSLVSGGCEPLRKKFTRKKKQDQKEKILPVLDPIDYPSTLVSPEKSYRSHYSLWMVWHKDLMTAFDEKAADKKKIYLVNQMLTRLEAMAALLEGDKKTAMQDLHKRLQRVIEEFDQPAALRSEYSIQREVISIDRDVRTHFRFKAVEGSLVKSMP